MKTLIIDYGHIFHPNAVGAWDYCMNEATATDFPSQFKANVLTNLTEIFKKYVDKNTEIIICLDGRDCWRKEAFPNYKVKRSKVKVEDNRDWDLIYKTNNEFIEELKTNGFPFIIAEHEKCEADDLVAILAKEKSKSSDVIIISSDKDFTPLQISSSITQFSRDGKEIKPKMTDDIYGQPNPHLEAEIMYLIGDSDDGIPNVFNTDYQYVADNLVKMNAKEITQTKQTVAQLAENHYNDIKDKELDDVDSILSFSFGKVTAAKLLAGDEKVIKKWGTIDEIKSMRNYRRNRKLIDLNLVPERLVEIVLDNLDDQILVSESSMMTYITSSCNTGYLRDEFLKSLSIDTIGDAQVQQFQKYLNK